MLQSILDSCHLERAVKAFQTIKIGVGTPS